jgi:protein phosphatase
MKVYAASHVGLVRTLNQDAFYAPKPGERFAAVADGLGGHKAGEIASSMAIEGFTRWLRCAPRPSEEAMRNAIIEANLAVYRESLAVSSRSGMGTTLTALWFADKHLFLAHVGDSRAYLFRNGAMMQLSRDHSLVGELLERGEITSHEALMHPQRHFITRVLGTGITVEPDIFRLNYFWDDVWILCTDGLSNMVSNIEMAELLSTPMPWEYRIDSMIKQALKRGGNDNITVLAAVGEESGL